MRTSTLILVRHESLIVSIFLKDLLKEVFKSFSNTLSLVFVLIGFGVSLRWTQAYIQNNPDLLNFIILSFLAFGFIISNVVCIRLLSLREKSIVTKSALDNAAARNYTIIAYFISFLLGVIYLILWRPSGDTWQIKQALGTSLILFVIGTISGLLWFKFLQWGKDKNWQISNGYSDQNHRYSQSLLENTLMDCCLRVQIPISLSRKAILMIPVILALTLLLVGVLVKAFLTDIFALGLVVIIAVPSILLLSRINHKMTRFYPIIGITYSDSVAPNCILLIIFIVSLIGFGMVLHSDASLNHSLVLAIVSSLVAVYSLIRLALYRSYSVHTSNIIIQLDLIVFSLLFLLFFPAAIFFGIYRIIKVREKVKRLYL